MNFLWPLHLIVDSKCLHLNYLIQISNSFTEKFELKEPEVRSICAFFTKLLAEIKHRGAFEQGPLTIKL